MRFMCPAVRMHDIVQPTIRSGTRDVLIAYTLPTAGSRNDADATTKGRRSDVFVASSDNSSSATCNRACNDPQIPQRYGGHLRVGGPDNSTCSCASNDSQVRRVMSRTCASELLLAPTTRRAVAPSTSDPQSHRVMMRTCALEIPIGPTT